MKVRVTLGVGVGVGLSPAAAPVLSAGAGVRAGRWSVGAEGLTVLPVTSSDVRSSLVAGGFVPCFHVWKMAGCAVVLAGVRRTSAREVQNDEPSFFFGAGLRAVLEVPIVGPLALRATGDLLGTMPATAYIANVQRWASSPIGAIWTAGMTAQF